MDLQTTVKAKFHPSKNKDPRNLDDSLTDLASAEIVRHSRTDSILSALLDFKGGLLEFAIASSGKIPSQDLHFIYLFIEQGISGTVSVNTSPSHGR